MRVLAHAQEVKDCHALGMTDKQIGEHIGRSATRVGEIRRELGLPINPSKASRSHKRIDREYLIREFDETMKALQAHGDHTEVRRQVRRVASEIGSDYKRVMAIYSHELGLIQLLPQRKYTKEQYAEAKRLLDEHGLSYTEVGKIVGIDRKMIAQTLPGRGLSPSDASTVRWVNRRMQKMGI